MIFESQPHFANISGGWVWVVKRLKLNSSSAEAERGLCLEKSISGKFLIKQTWKISIVDGLIGGPIVLLTHAKV